MSIVDRIDDFFYNKTKKDFLYFIVLIVGIVVFVIYYFIYPIVLSYYKKQYNNFNSLTSKFNSLKVNNNVLNVRINLLKKEIKQIQLSSLKNKKIFYTELANLLDFTEFDEYKWSNIVKNSILEATKNGMKIYNVNNIIYDKNFSKGDITKKMDISMNLKGKYENFIEYLYQYENRKDLIRINEMNITYPGNFFVKFTIYGYNK